MPIRTELNLRLPNSPGALAAVYRALADGRVGVLAICLGAMGQLRLVTDNPVRAAGVLRALHHRVTERDVLVLSTAPDVDMLAGLLAVIREAGINIEYAYGGGDSRSPGVLVVGVDEAMRAATMTGL